MLSPVVKGLRFFSGHSFFLPFDISLSLRLNVGYCGNKIETQHKSYIMEVTYIIVINQLPQRE